MRRYGDKEIAILMEKGLLAQFPPEKKRKHEESDNQQLVVKWWAVVCRNYNIPEIALMAFPLQGARTEQNGARMKAEGCRRGTLDMMLSVMKGGYGALWIENKVPGEKLKPHQIVMRGVLETAGYKVVVCFTAKECINAIETYLTL